MKFAIKLLRYLKGYVSVRATGGFPERFLNLCHAGRIRLWDVCLYENVLTFCVSRSHFIKLRKTVAKSGTKIAIIKKTGLIYKYRKSHKRVGIITGVILFLSLHLILNMFVWCVDVKGNKSISKSDILTRAEYYGLKPGTMKKGFDEIRASRNIATDYNGKVTWLSINIKGSLAIIELREDEKIIDGVKDGPPCNIVADFDGVIISAETFCGDCAVKKGYGVKKGDLLISGTIINEDLSTDFYAAKGKFTALHDKEICFTENKKNIFNKVKINEENYSIGFFGIKIPFLFPGRNENGLFFTERKSLNINGYDLPFYIEKSVLCNTEKVKENKNSIYILEKFQHSIYNQNANSNLINKNESLTIDGNSIIFNGKYTLIDFLGEEKPILTENPK